MRPATPGERSVARVATFCFSCLREHLITGHTVYVLMLPAWEWVSPKPFPSITAAFLLLFNSPSSRLSVFAERGIENLFLTHRKVRTEFLAAAPAS